MKPKLLCILHCSPPNHGAAKVGDFIAESKKLSEHFECQFIAIKSSNSISDIGRVNLKKIYFSIELFFKVLWALLCFRPDKIYFTASIKGVAFYRDLVISLLWKTYSLFKRTKIYYHYHTKGVDSWISQSGSNLKLTQFFLKNVNLILLSKLLEKDFIKMKTYSKVYYLSNGVEDLLSRNKFEIIALEKYREVKTIEVLYLAHMMEDKGYWDVLKLAKKTKGQNIRYHFAGSWQNAKNKHEFLEFVKINDLGGQVTYHGFVSGSDKVSLFERAHFLLYPSKNDAFPLTILESLSYGVPVISTNEGAIADILDEKSGIIIFDVDKLYGVFKEAQNKLLNVETAKCCRQRYLDNFTLDCFEDNLVQILGDK
ncbi:glycosyltransferase [Francisellaceae bacterium]|nr:glycosyltransferase [Francisellaceae bacterium]